MATDAVADIPDGLIPQVFDGGQETSYIFVRCLGAGAFAEANLYRKIEDNSLVVWKEINMARLGDKEKKDSLNEIEILFLLNHANIITYYNHFMDGDTLLIELEYANGGNLAQKIDKQKELFEEETVKWYLYQLASALAHCHEHGIIHRDMKCLNIFTTKTDLLKLGDFGISKELQSASQMAETVAGTPLYMSPELIKGEKYDYKTDIWGLGCVLFELLTLTKTFHGTNHLQVAYEIVTAEHGEVDSRYSTGIRELLDKMLCKDAKGRPTAKQVIESDVLKNREIYERRVYELNTGTRRSKLQTSVSMVEQTVVPVVKSKVTEVFQWGGGKVVPQRQDIFVKGRSAAMVSAGYSHFAVVTMEKEVYTWANVQGGNKIVGQLGHGNTAAYKTPKKVEAFEGTGIIQAECGEDFTVCLSDDGQLYSFGSDYNGCLGCDGGEEEVTSPVRIETFLRQPVQQISCGDNHVVALTKDGDVYTWGCGEFGRLGLGSEDDFTTPQKAELRKKHLVKHVSAGTDGTLLLTTTGRVLACGSNEHNKLGFNSETSGLKKHKPQVYDIPCKLTFTLVRPLIKRHVVSIATGSTHSAVIDVCGHLYTFGSNKYGQLGVGDFRDHTGVCRVLAVLINHRVENVTCGDGFTVASTSGNYVYAWGNGENGRLGFGQLDLAKGPNGKSVSIPRPIFGALHAVPHLSARQWHTILIAEKVLNQKTLKTRCSLPKIHLSDAKGSEAGSTPGDSAFSTDEGEAGDQTDNDITSFILSGDSGKPASPDSSSPFSLVPSGPGSASPQAIWEEDREDNLPPWLEEELNDDVIPIPVGFVIQSPQLVGHYHNPNVGPQGFNWQQQQQGAGFTPVTMDQMLPLGWTPPVNNLSPSPMPPIPTFTTEPEKNTNIAGLSMGSVVSTTPQGSVSSLSPNLIPRLDTQVEEVTGEFMGHEFLNSSEITNGCNEGTSQGSQPPENKSKDAVIEDLRARVKALEEENVKIKHHYESIVNSLQVEIKELKQGK